MSPKALAKHAQDNVDAFRESMTQHVRFQDWLKDHGKHLTHNENGYNKDYTTAEYEMLFINWRSLYPSA